MPQLNETDTKGNPGIPSNRPFPECYPLKMGSKSAQTLEIPIFNKVPGRKVEVFFLIVKCRNRGSILKKRYFSTTLLPPPDYPKCEYPV